MTYEIKEHSIEPIKVMSIRTVVPFAEIGSRMDELFTRLYGHLIERGAKLLPMPFALYHAENSTESVMDLELCAPVEEFVDGSDEGDIAARTVDGVKGPMIWHMHKGSYEELGNVYPAMIKWMEDQGYEWNTDFPMREIYVNDPDRTPPEELLTEIVWSVKAK